MTATVTPTASPPPLDPPTAVALVEFAGLLREGKTPVEAFATAFETTVIELHRAARAELAAKRTAKLAHA